MVQQGIANETDWFKVQYEDGDTEWLCLSTLETDGTLGLQGPAERRVKWCLCEHTKVTNGLSQATGAPTMQPMADDGKVSELQAEVAQAQSEINAANKRPTRAAKARAQVLVSLHQVRKTLQKMKQRSGASYVWENCKKCMTAWLLT